MAREPSLVSGVVEHGSAGHEGVANRFFEPQPVDDLKRKVRALKHRARPR